MTETKEHILKVAFMLFLQKNFKEVTMKEIVDKTGLSKGAFYHYFESKEKLFEEVINSFFESAVTRRYADAEPVSLYQFYHEAISDFDFMSDSIYVEKGREEELFNVNFFALIFDALKLLPGFHLKMQEYHKREMDTWVKVIRRARKQGEIDTLLSDKQIATIYLTTADGLAMNQTLHNKPGGLQKEVKQLWDSFYKSIKV